MRSYSSYTELFHDKLAQREKSMAVLNQIPEDMNWADYCDALLKERYSLPAIRQRRLKSTERDAHDAGRVRAGKGTDTKPATGDMAVKGAE